MNQILFALALNSTRDQVLEVVDSIFGFFNIENTASGVSAAAVFNQQNNGVTADHVAQMVATDNGTAPAATNNAALDSAGMPWDERIHASTKAKTENGTWRARRGVDATAKARIEAELRATMGAPATPATTPPATVTAPIAPAAPTAPGLPPIPGANLALPQVEENPYTQFVAFVVANTHSATNPTGRLTDDWVKQVLAHYGVADGSLQNLAHRADLIPQIESYIRNAIGQ